MLQYGFHRPNGQTKKGKRQRNEKKQRKRRGRKERKGRRERKEGSRKEREGKRGERKEGREEKEQGGAMTKKGVGLNDFPLADLELPSVFGYHYTQKKAREGEEMEGKDRKKKQMETKRPWWVPLLTQLFLLLVFSCLRLIPDGDDVQWLISLMYSPTFWIYSVS